MSNFDFLKKIDNDLFETILVAEKLYRDEYFDQCVAQTRKFAENICKKVLADKTDSNYTFDEMLATLKDKSGGTAREKEFIEDLYFLKREGNSSVHSIKTKKDAFTALECIKRAFEAALNYALSKDKSNKALLSLQFDEELLILGVRKKKTLQEKYLEQKARMNRTQPVKTSEKVKKTKAKKTPLKNKKKIKASKAAKKQGVSLFWKIVVSMATLGVIAGYFLIK